jgi:hypothetical protein
MLRFGRDRSDRRRVRQVAIAMGLMALFAAGMAQAQSWVDDFGSYTPGAFPSPPWTNSGNTQASVEAGSGVGGSQSLKLYGVLGGCWGALAHRPVAVTPPYTIQVSIKNGAEPLSGCHPLYGNVNLNTGSSWTTDERALLVFDSADPATGKRYIRGDWGGTPPGVDINLGEYAPDTWYTVKMHYERVNAQTVRISYWIDNVFKGGWDVPALAYEDNLTYLSLQSAEGSAWFDNVSVSPSAAPTQAAGRIVVANDDWVLSNTGFAAPNDPSTFATNVAAWFTGGRPGKFHAYSDHFGLTGGSLAAAMTAGGHTWTTGTASFNFDLATLRQYDGIFLLVAPADNQVLIDYVEAGGNVYLAYSGDGSRLDEQYNPFVNHFGLGLGTINNGIVGNVATNDSHSIFAGVDHLYNVNGSDIVDLAPDDPRQGILVSQNGHGLYAVYDGRTGVFSAPDLAGTWRWHIFQDFTAANGPLWGLCTVTVGATGTVTSGSCTNNLDVTASVTSGALALNSTGEVTGSLALSNGFNPTILGTLDPSKTIMAQVSNPAGSPSLVIGIKVRNGMSAVPGDFNADRLPDLLWQHATSGDVYLWAMDGMSHTGGTYLARGMAPWKVVGTPDLTADGQPDLLWQHATSGDVYLWPMNGTTQAGGTYLARNMGPWKVVATGDLCGGDGKPDLLWQHETTGDVYCWCMTGTTMTSGTYLAQGMGLWKVVATADLNGDGKADLVWQHATSGDVYIWFMNGTTQIGGAYLASGLGSWKVVATADLNGDGKPDLLWQDSATSDVYVWFLNGTTVTSGAYVAQGMEPWKVVGPR